MEIWDLPNQKLHDKIAYKRLKESRIVAPRAVYTSIKKPWFFTHFGFSLEVARQLPLNTAKNLNKKTHLRSVVFWNSASFHCFFSSNVNACSPLAGIIRVGGHMGRDPPGNHPQPATYCALRSKAARSHACAPLTKKQNEIQVFPRMRFSCQNPPKKVIWVSLAV